MREYATDDFAAAKSRDEASKKSANDLDVELATKRQEAEAERKKRYDAAQAENRKLIDEAQALSRNWKPGTPLPTQSRTGAASS